MVLAARESVQILLRHVHSDISADQTEQLLLKAIRTREDAIRVLNLTKEAIPLVKHAGKNATIEALQAGGEKRWTSGAAPKVWVWKRS